MGVFYVENIGSVKVTTFSLYFILYLKPVPLRFYGSPSTVFLGGSYHLWYQPLGLLLPFYGSMFLLQTIHIGILNSVA